MAHRTQPLASGPHSLAPASIGDRLNKRASGHGLEPAKLIWFAVLSHTPWTRVKRPTWASNETLANETVIMVSEVERGIRRLRQAKMLETAHGHRRGASRQWGRILKPAIASPVKVLIPDRAKMANLWATCRQVRKKPISLVTMVVGAYVLAAHELDRRPFPTCWSHVPGSAADLRRLVGARKNQAWTRRLRDAEEIGLLARDGRDIMLAPVAGWMRGQRAIADASEEPAREGRGPPFVGGVEAMSIF